MQSVVPGRYRQAGLAGTELPCRDRVPTIFAHFDRISNDARPFGRSLAASAEAFPATASSWAAGTSLRKSVPTDGAVHLPINLVSYFAANR